MRLRSNPALSASSIAVLVVDMAFYKTWCRLDGLYCSGSARAGPGEVALGGADRAATEKGRQRSRDALLSAGHFKHHSPGRAFDTALAQRSNESGLWGRRVKIQRSGDC